MLGARICDPAGPAWWRTVTSVGLLPLAVLGVALPGSSTARAVTMLVGIAWLVVGRLVVPRLRPRAASLDVAEGVLRVKGAGVLSQRIAAADVRAASTAVLPGGACSLALVRHEEGDPPLWLELGNREDLDQVRRALGIGHGGFGVLRWPPERGGFHNRPSVADAVASAGWLAIVGAAWVGTPVFALWLAIPAIVLTLGSLVWAATPRPGRERVVLSPQGIHVVIGAHRALLPWDTVVDAKVEGTSLSIATIDRAEVVPMRSALPVEREHLAAQIRSAVARSRGEGPLPPELPAALAVLSRRDEGRRAWLERLDATAASLAQGDGYRHAGIAANDLWATLESPDAPATLRAGAARILARVAPDEAGARIAKALATEHDAETRQCIRVALEEDVEVAAAELDRVERRSRI
jgi:hypothetical protein